MNNSNKEKFVATLAMLGVLTFIITMVITFSSEEIPKEEMEECGSKVYYNGQLNHQGTEYRILACVDTGRIVFQEVDDKSGTYYVVVPRMHENGMEYTDLEIINN